MENQNPTIVPANSLDDWFDKVATTEETTPVVETKIEDLFDKKEEVPSEEKKEEKKEELKLPETKVEEKNTTLSNQVKFLIDKGYWEDYDVEVQDPETGETKLVPITELDITDEVFEQLEQAQKDKKEEDFKSKYVSVEGLDETTKKMIELKKSGGDITPLLQAEAEFVSPISKLNLEDEGHQEYLVRQRLSLNPDLDQVDIDNKIKRLKENLTLDIEAKKIADDVTEKFNTWVEEKNKEHLARVEALKEEQKQFTKTIRDTYKGFDIKNENLLKGLVEKATKTDEHGLTEVDKAYFDAKKNPELFAKVNFLLTNEDAFNEFMGIKIKNKVSIETAKNILKLSPKMAKQVEDKKQQSGSEIDKFFDNKN